MDSAAPHDVSLRSARDRLIDLLGIGDSYPLSDLHVVADQLKVAFGKTAKIPIEHAQVNVTYELCNPKGQPLGSAVKGDGAGGTLVIETPPVKKDVTYRLQATKKPRAGSPPPHQDSRFLDEPAPVKVGLDTGLVIEIVDFRTPDMKAPVQAPLLDPTISSPRPSDPRLVPFGATVNVRVSKSQDGVEYSLMLDNNDIGGRRVRGNLASLTMSAGPLAEDTVVRVRATRTFDATEESSAETNPLNATLEAKLYVKVMANPALAVSIESSPIVDYRRGATIRVAKTQSSAKYRAYARTIPDRDFVRRPTGASVVTIPVASKPDVLVLKPARTDTWRTPDGYTPIGDAPAAGTGGDLKFTVQTLMDDTIVIVQAIKDHQDDTRPKSPSIASSIRLDQAAVALVRPDPSRALTLRVPIAGAQTGDTLQVSNGQPGVFYFLRPAAAGAEFPLPAYFHKRDDQDGTANKGVGQLGVTIDLVVAGERVGKPERADPARLFPPDPVLKIPSLAAGSRLLVRAMKAQTGVDTEMTQATEIAAVPDIRAQQPVVNDRGVATIVIAASRPEDQYQLTLKGAALRPAAAGTGGTLSFTSDPLTSDTTFEVVITRTADKGMRVERVVQVPVKVRPAT